MRIFTREFGDQFGFDHEGPRRIQTQPMSEDVRPIKGLCAGRPYFPNTKNPAEANAAGFSISPEKEA
jgi:hypothetical protein